MNFVITLIYCLLLLVVAKVTATVCQLISIPPNVGGIIVIAIMAIAIYYLEKLKAKIKKKKG